MNLYVFEGHEDWSYAAGMFLVMANSSKEVNQLIDEHNAKELKVYYESYGGEKAFQEKYPHMWPHETVDIVHSWDGTSPLTQTDNAGYWVLTHIFRLSESYDEERPRMISYQYHDG